MLTETDYLLICADEECAEVQQAISKALRFGLGDNNPHTPRQSNAVDIAYELADTIAIFRILQEKNIIPTLDLEKLISNKRDKVSKYLEISKKLGRVKCN